MDMMSQVRHLFWLANKFKMLKGEIRVWNREVLKRVEVNMWECL